jgi:bifunctional non-homologous end joining protein LigD
VSTTIPRDPRALLRHPDKVLFPSGHTKGDLWRYYQEVAPVLLPHLRDRPVTLVRCPDGTQGGAFYQKNRPAGTPSWMPDVVLGETRYLLCQEPLHLALFAQWAAVEIHVPLCRLSPDGTSLEPPDQVVVDLDPMPPAGWREVARAARGLRRLLQEAGVQGLPKTSGATGLHVYLPVRPSRPSQEWEQAVKTLARFLARSAPDVYTAAWRVAQRHGVYVDYGQNAPGRTMAAPYSVRALPRPQVSTPVSWEELEEGEVHPGLFTVDTVPPRIAQVGDLFSPALGCPQDLTGLVELAKLVR